MRAATRAILAVGIVMILAGGRLQAAPVRILVFSGLVGFRHASIPDGISAIRAIGAQRGWTVDASEDPAVFTDAGLRGYDVVVWNNSCGNDDTREILAPAQKTAFERYLHSGKGTMGIHCSSCAGTAGPGDWTWFNDMFGAINTGHPAGTLQFQTARLSVENRSHPSTRHLPATWPVKDEWFYYNRSPRPDVTVLLSLDEKSYQPGNAMGDHPIAWCRNYKGGRVFYTGIGHMSENYADPNFLKHLEGGLQWAAGLPDSGTVDPTLPSPGMILDLDADKGLTLEEGDRVAGWRSQASFRARDFLKNDAGRTVPGSGRPTLKRSVAALRGHNSLSFRSQELVNQDEDAFDGLTQGQGYTWIAVMAPYAQVIGEPNVNVFFGNLRNGQMYEGLWGAFDDDGTLWCGSRNGITFGRWNADNPKVSGPYLEPGGFRVLAARMGAGSGTVRIEMFVDAPGAPVASAAFPVNAAANPSRMAVGTERDAKEHPGMESFDGEIARFLIYDRPLSDAELAGAFAALRAVYFTAPTGIHPGGSFRATPRILGRKDALGRSWRHLPNRLNWGEIRNTDRSFCN